MNKNTFHHTCNFEWRQHNQFRLLIDGQQFYPDILQRIREARQFIYMEMYLMESGHISSRFINALREASQNNVLVYLLLDAYGSQQLSQADQQHLLDQGIKLCLYNPLQYHKLKHNLFRDHRKLILIDGDTAYTGGAGITDAFDNIQHPIRYWHDAMVRIEGECVTDWQHLFENNWQRWSDIQLPAFARNPVSNALTQSGRVVESRSIRNSEAIRSFIQHIRHSKQKTWLATAYFIPSRKIRRALCKSANRGTDVRLLLPGPYSDHPWTRHMGQHYYSHLLKNGVRIFEFQPRFQHIKILLCDHWVSIGSSNFDRWNFRWNLEANQEINDADFASDVCRQFESDFSESTEILKYQWQQRPLGTKLKIWFWSRIASLLSHFSYNRRENSD